MDAATLFDLANAGALIGWLMLAFAPLKRPWLVLGARIVGLVLAVLYSGLLIGAVMGGGMEGDFTSLAGVTALFARPEGVLVGWVHYLAFDLWVGAWQVERAPQDGLSHWVLVPCLVLTFLFGPVGLLLFVIARTVTTRMLTTRGRAQ